MDNMEKGILKIIAKYHIHSFQDIEIAFRWADKKYDILLCALELASKYNISLTHAVDCVKTESITKNLLIEHETNQREFKTANKITF